MISKDQIKSLGFTPLGFDLETSTGNPETGVILSIGAVDVVNEREFYCELKYDQLTVEPKALRVNKLNVTEIDSSKDGTERLRPSVADIELVKFLHGRKYIPVGFNIIHFDMRYVANCLPKSAAILGRIGTGYPVGMDLNALCIEIAIKETFGWKGIKKQVKSTAKAQLQEEGIEESNHNAIYDARLALKALELLVSNKYMSNI